MPVGDSERRGWAQPAGISQQQTGSASTANNPSARPARHAIQAGIAGDEAEVHRILSADASRPGTVVIESSKPVGDGGTKRPERAARSLLICALIQRREHACAAS